MSNRDPLYNSSKADASDLTANQTGLPTSGDSGNMKDKTEQTKNEGMNKANDMANKASDKASEVGYEGLDKANEMADKAGSMMDDGKQKAGEMAGMAQQRADEGMDKAADAMGKGADMLRERGSQQGGTVGQVADTAAGAMESAGQYLHEHDTGEMMDQVEAYIRKNPTQSLLIAAGVGFVLAKAFK